MLPKFQRAPREIRKFRTHPTAFFSTSRFQTIPDLSLRRPVPLWRHRIISRRAEGATPQKPPEGQPAPLQYAVNPQRLNAIYRTGRFKAATIAQMRRKHTLIHSHKKDKNLAQRVTDDGHDYLHPHLRHPCVPPCAGFGFHSLARRQTVSKSRITSWHFLPAIPARAIRIRSVSCTRLCRLNRKASRINRLARLRSTAR